MYQVHNKSDEAVAVNTGVSSIVLQPNCQMTTTYVGNIQYLLGVCDIFRDGSKIMSFTKETAEEVINKLEETEAQPTKAAKKTKKKK